MGGLTSSRFMEAYSSLVAFPSLQRRGNEAAPNIHMIACSDDPQRTAVDRSESSQGVSCPRWIAPVRGGRNLIRNSKRRVLRASWTERRRKIHLDELHNRFLSGNGWTDPAHGL